MYFCTVCHVGQSNYCLSQNIAGVGESNYRTNYSRYQINGNCQIFLRGSHKGLTCDGSSNITVAYCYRVDRVTVQGNFATLSNINNIGRITTIGKGYLVAGLQKFCSGQGNSCGNLRGYLSGTGHNDVRKIEASVTTKGQNNLTCFAFIVVGDRVGLIIVSKISLALGTCSSLNTLCNHLISYGKSCSISTILTCTNNNLGIAVYCNRSCQTSGSSHTVIIVILMGSCQGQLAISSYGFSSVYSLFRLGNDRTVGEVVYTGILLHYNSLSAGHNNVRNIVGSVKGQHYFSCLTFIINSETVCVCEDSISCNVLINGTTGGLGVSYNINTIHLNGTTVVMLTSTNGKGSITVNLNGNGTALSHRNTVLATITFKRTGCTGCYGQLAVYRNSGCFAVHSSGNDGFIQEIVQSRNCNFLSPCIQAIAGAKIATITCAFFLSSRYACDTTQQICGQCTYKHCDCHQNCYNSVQSLLKAFGHLFFLPFIF